MLQEAVRPFSFFALLLLLAVPAVSALEVPKKPQGYVNDWANLLSPSTRTKLEDRLRAFEEKTGNQVVVVIFPSLEGQSLEDFSIRLAEAWKIGQKGKDNGVIFLIFWKDRKMRIEVGYGLEGVLPDIVAGQIIRDVVAPYFQKGDARGGINAGVNAIMQATQGEFKGTGGAGEVGCRATGHEPVLVFWLIIFFFLLLLQMVQSLVGYRIGGKGGGFSSGGLSGGGFGGGGFSGGGGGFGGGGASGRW